MSEEQPSMEQRLALLERDARDHAKSLSEIISTISRPFTPEQLQQLRMAFREELSAAGLRIDAPEHVDSARRDFMFLRSSRLAVTGIAAKIGWVVIAAFLGAVIWLVNTGLNVWKG